MKTTNMNFMIENIVMLLTVLLTAYVLVTSGAPQIWDGSTCDTRRCLRDEVCVMEQGPCDYRGHCSHRATCRISRSSNNGSCWNLRCPPGQFCTMMEDRCAWKPCPSRPICVSANNTGYGMGWRVHRDTSKP